MTAILAGLGVALGLGVWRQLPPMELQTRAGLFAVVCGGMLAAYLLGLHGRRSGGASASASAVAAAQSSSAVQVNLFGSMAALDRAEWRGGAARDGELTRSAVLALGDAAEDFDPVEARELADAGRLDED